MGPILRQASDKRSIESALLDKPAVAPGENRGQIPPLEPRYEQVHLPGLGTILAIKREFPEMTPEHLELAGRLTETLDAAGLCEALP
jgi:hypothetical protein